MDFQYGVESLIASPHMKIWTFNVLSMPPLVLLRLGDFSIQEWRKGGQRDKGDKGGAEEGKA